MLISRDVIFSLLLWTVNATGYTPPQFLPIVAQISAKEMAVIACDGQERCPVEAIYEHRRSIYVTPYEDPLHFKAALVHELVHFLQYHNGRDHEKYLTDRVECLEIEGEAHTVSLMFLRENGVFVRPDEWKFSVYLQCSRGG